MIRYIVTLTPHSSLYIGGYAHAFGASNGDTATDAQGMLVPGSALKGALREAAFRLVRGAGRGKEILRNLFGDAENEGVLRVGPLRCEESPELSVRHHVSLDRATRQAASGRLFQNRVTAAGYGLCFRGELTVARDLDDDERGLLESARRITDQLGGGRGRGLGLVSVELERAPTVPLSAEESPLVPQRGSPSLLGRDLPGVEFIGPCHLLVEVLHETVDLPFEIGR